MNQPCVRVCLLSDVLGPVVCRSISLWDEPASFPLLQGLQQITLQAKDAAEPADHLRYDNAFENSATQLCQMSANRKISLTTAPVRRHFRPAVPAASSVLSRSGRPLLSNADSGLPKQSPAFCTAHRRQSPQYLKWSLQPRMHTCVGTCARVRVLCVCTKK